MNLKIFVVNKVYTHRRRTVQALKKAGYANIHEFKNVYEAQVIIDETQGNFLVIQELNNLDSTFQEFDFFKQISKNRGQKNVSILVTSLLPDMDLAQEFFYAGAAKFLIVPHDIEVYSQMLKRTIDKIC